MEEKVRVYIDGFNLYFGIKQKCWNSLLWLDLRALAKSFLKPGQKLSAVHYFTSRVRNNPEKEKRQNTYLEALEARKGVKIHYGHYQLNFVECRYCGRKYPSPSEKMTDVNIAVEMLSDAFEDKVDTAILISGDSDLVPPIRQIRKLFPEKKIVVAFPPARHNSSLQQAASASFIIGRKKLKDSQLLDKVEKADGFILIKPAKWEGGSCSNHPR